MPQSHDPDRDYIYWVNNWGEFSLKKTEDFEKNCAKINYDINYNPYYKRYNGNKLKAVLNDSRLFYGRSGLEGL